MVLHVDRYQSRLGPSNVPPHKPIRNSVFEPADAGGIFAGELVQF